MTIWGTFPVAIKWVLFSVNVPTFLIIRFAFSALLLIGMCPGIIRKIKHIKSSYLTYFFIAIAITFSTQMVALDELPVTFFIVFFTLTPIFLHFILKLGYSRLIVAGVLLAIGGVFLFFTTAPKVASHLTFMGMLMLFLGSISWCVYSYLIRKIHAVLNDLEIAALTNYCAFFSSLATLLIKPKWLLIQHLTGSVTAIICLLSGCMTAAFFLYSYAMRLKPVFATFSQYLEPILGLLASALVFHEILSLLQWLSVFITIAGTVLVAYGERVL